MNQTSASTSQQHALAWAQLQDLAQQKQAKIDLRDLFANDAQRFEKFKINAPYLWADLSKNLVDGEIWQALLQLAHASGVESGRVAMWAGEHINNTEDRAVMHFLLRSPANAVLANEKVQQAHALVHGTLNPMLAFAEKIRANSSITDVVNIGIGGSDLGPLMATIALNDFATTGKRMHFVSNVDAHEINRVLKPLNPNNTLVLVASKTFTTAETMANAQTAKAWFEANGGTQIAEHFVGLTTNLEAAAQFGISTTFGFWDWVGGRYSMWSAIGLSLAIAVGADNFKAMLKGAHEMDEHFKNAPLENNLPVALALLDVWYRNFMGFSSRSVAPYHSALARFPAYLQQLEMESNGKRVDRNGKPLNYGTSGVVWGEPGTNGQHAFFQMLHQGTDVVPVEFIGVKHPSHHIAGHHTQLLANMLAQSQALMLGQEGDGGARFFPGNRPSTTFVLDRLTPESFGALVACYEHRVFVAGLIWNINSFDQWGVELGKVLAKNIAKSLETGDTQGLDASSAGMVAALRSE